MGCGVLEDLTFLGRDCWRSSSVGAKEFSLLRLLMGCWCSTCLWILLRCSICVLTEELLVPHTLKDVCDVLR